MKNIGIVTFYNAINNGAFLQAYAMQTFLQENQFQVKMLAVKKFKPSENPYSQKCAETLSKCSCLLNVAEEFCGCDAVVYGSDEIWNLRNSGLSPRFWGFGIKSQKKIVYAACTGNSKLTDYYLFPYTIWGLRKFDAISVRDEESYVKISKLTRKQVDIVLDPTFLISYDKYKTDNPYGKYVLVYTYGLSKQTIDLIRDYAARNACKIILTGSSAEWADYNICANPFEWISLIYNAELVFSSTFHGTVFSIICKKQFFVVDTESDKVKDLLGKLELENRKSLDFLRTEPIDYMLVAEKLEPLVQKSKQFLLDNLR